MSRLGCLAMWCQICAREGHHTAQHVEHDLLYGVAPEWAELALAALLCFALRLLEMRSRRGWSEA